MKTWRRIALLALASLLLSPALGASGVRIEHHLTLEEVVKRVRQILAIEIVRLDHVYNTPQCAPSAVPFVRSFRAEARVKEVLTGEKTLKGRRVWVVKQGAFVPCRWILLKEYYTDTPGWAEVKPGSRLFAYVSSQMLPEGPDGDLYLELLGMDGVDKRAQVLKALKLPDLPPEQPSALASAQTITSAEPRTTKAPAVVPRPSASATGGSTAPRGSHDSPGCSLTVATRSRSAPNGVLVLVLLAALRQKGRLRLGRLRGRPPAG